MVKKGFLLLFLVLGFFFSNVEAQTISFKKSDNWMFLYEVQGVNFYYRVVVCDDNMNDIHNEYVVLKVENTNDSIVQVDWDVVPYYNERCYNCKEELSPEYHRKIQLLPNQTLEGNCLDHHDVLSVSPTMKNENIQTKSLTKFYLSNLTIKQNH